MDFPTRAKGLFILEWAGYTAFADKCVIMIKGISHHSTMIYIKPDLVLCIWCWVGTKLVAAITIYLLSDRGRRGVNWLWCFYNSRPINDPQSTVAEYCGSISWKYQGGWGFFNSHIWYVVCRESISFVGYQNQVVVPYKGTCCL